MGVQLGIKLLECVRWEQVAPGVRLRAILVILAARTVAPRDWSWKYMLSVNNRKLTAGMFEVFTIK